MCGLRVVYVLPMCGSIRLIRLYLGVQVQSTWRTGDRRRIADMQKYLELAVPLVLLMTAEKPGLAGTFRTA